MHPIEEKIPSLPTGPGVYIMKGGQDEVLYVGKAKNLRARVRSYVRAGAGDHPKTVLLVPKVKELDTIVTQTEKEALLLENTLIKKYRPRYNIDLKDDKTYLNILLDRNHPFPRFVPVRKQPKLMPGQTFFGPYSSASAMRATLRQIQRLYPLRTCTDREFGSRKRPCIQAQMGRCSAACVGEITEEAYGEMVDQAALILQGRSEELLRQQETKMLEAADAMRFEEAARIRDRIHAIRLTIEQQRVVDAREADRDVVGDYQEKGFTALALLRIRDGKLVERKSFSFRDPVVLFPELLRSFVLQYYAAADRTIPPEILLPQEPEDRKALEEVLSELRGAGLSIKVPKRGEKKQLIDMARLNAKSLCEEQTSEEHRLRNALEEIQRKLRLPKAPNRIECFDISNLGGEQAVGSSVLFVEGRPFKDGYRRYRIRTREGVDDYGMMYEVLMRRLERGKKEGDLPDLLLIDGGKGHLGVATRVLKDTDVLDVRAAAIAKARRRRRPDDGEEASYREEAQPAGSQKEALQSEPLKEDSAGTGTGAEGASGSAHVTGDSPGDREDKEGGVPTEQEVDRIFLPGRSNPVPFTAYADGFRLLQRIRDEAHRFALMYHRKLRSREMERSELDAVPGVGARRKQALLQALGDVEGVRNASVEELAEVQGMNRKSARAVWGYFHE